MPNPLFGARLDVSIFDVSLRSHRLARSSTESVLLALQVKCRYHGHTSPGRAAIAMPTKSADGKTADERRPEQRSLLRRCFALVG